MSFIAVLLGSQEPILWQRTQSCQLFVFMDCSLQRLSIWDLSEYRWSLPWPLPRSSKYSGVSPGFHICRLNSSVLYQGCPNNVNNNGVKSTVMAASRIINHCTPLHRMCFTENSSGISNTSA